jgi:hypothetical protein
VGEPVVAVTRSRIAALGLALLLALSFCLPALAGKEDKGGIHKPPYKKGPSGGDEFNHVESDPQSGTVEVYRLFPGFSPVVGCEPEPAAGWAMLRESHRVTKKLSTLTARFDASLDPYAWVSVGARTKSGKWLAIDKFQGPFEGSGRLKVRFHHRPRRGSTITLEFGVQLGDACPQAGVARATFTRLVVD